MVLAATDPREQRPDLVALTEKQVTEELRRGGCIGLRNSSEHVR
ncbi:hypothetical protein ACIA47_16445 [Micromonospora sp. NPDC051227]